MMMKSVFHSGFVALAALAWAQDGTVLRKTLAEGTVDQYRIEFSLRQTISTEQAGAQQFDVGGSMTYTTKIGKFDADKKVSDVGITLSSMKFDLQGMAVVLQQVAHQGGGFSRQGARP